MTDRRIAIRIGLEGAEVKREIGEITRAGTVGFENVAQKIGATGDQAAKLTQRLQAIAAAARQATASDEAQRSFNRFFGVTADPKGAQAGASAKVLEEHARAADKAEKETRELAAAIAEANTQAAAFANQKSFAEFFRITEDPKGAQAGASGAVFEQAALALKQEAAAAEAMRAKAAQLRAEIDPLGTATARMNARVAESNALFKQGAITATENARAHQFARLEFDRTAQSLKFFGTEGKLSAFAMQNLGFQVNDIFVSLASGQSPFRVLIQQGAQIVQLFGPGAGLKGILGGLGEAFLRIVTPIRAVTTGLVGIGAAGVVSYSNVVAKQKEVERALAGTGRIAGATAADIELIAASSAEASRISVGAARDLELAFARTGRVGKELFDELIEATVRYAETTGVTLEEATEALTAAFADPERGVDELNRKLGFLDDQTRRYIVTLAKQNDLTGAQKALLDAMLPSLDAAESHTSALGRAWNFVGRNARFAFDAMGQAIDRVFSPTLEQRIRGLESAIPDLGGAARSDAIRELRALLQQADAQRRSAAQDAAEQKANLLSLQAGDIARSVLPGFQGLDTLRNQRATLDSALNDPLARQKVNLNEVAEARARVTGALNTYVGAAERAHRITGLEIDALKAISPEQRRDIARRREELELRGQLITAKERETRINDAGRAAFAAAQAQIDFQSKALRENAQATIAVADAWGKSAEAAEVALARREAILESLRNGVDIEFRTQDLIDQFVSQQLESGAETVNQLNAETEVRRRLHDEIDDGLISYEKAQAQLQIELTLRPLLIARALAEGEAKEKLTQTINELTDALKKSNEEQARDQSLQIKEGQREQIEFLSKEIELIGVNERERNKILARLAAEQDLRRNNIDLQSEEGEAILKNAERIQVLTDQLDLSQEAFDRIQNAGEQAFDRFGDLILEGKLDWESWRDAGIAAIKDILSELIRLAALNPLKNALFGTNHPTLGGLLGLGLGALGGLGGGGGAGAGAVGNFDFAFAHSGGRPGIDTLPMKRLPVGLLANAPRFHTGSGDSLSRNEIPAVLLKGERVLNPQETRDYESGAWNRMPFSMPSRDINVTVKIDGARGNREIEEAAERGTVRAIAIGRQELQAYDRNLDRRVMPIIDQKVRDPRLL